jgi:glycine/D-amino acid oxidase-like deaminating enzyme
MKEHTRVVVVGGGIVGAAMLYHLTKSGWSDVARLQAYAISVINSEASYDPSGSRMRS